MEGVKAAEPGKPHRHYVYLRVNTENLPPLPLLPQERRDIPFIHKSVLQQRIPHQTGWQNELDSQKPSEYLGDKALGLWVATALMKVRFRIQPGVMTDIVSAIVSNVTLAQVSQAYGLGEKLQLNASADRNGLRHDPKVLADTFEAYIGECWRAAEEDDLMMGHYEGSGEPRPFQAFRDFIGAFVSPAVFPDLWTEIDDLQKTEKNVAKRTRDWKRRRTGDQTDTTGSADTSLSTQ